MKSSISWLEPVLITRLGKEDLGNAGSRKKKDFGVMTSYLQSVVGVFGGCELLKSEWKLLSTFQEKLYEKYKLPPNDCFVDLRR